MILGDLATKARSLVNANTVNYTDANLLIDMNIWYQKVGTMIYESQDDSDFDDLRNTTYPQYTTSLVAGQRDYAIASTLNILQIKRLDVTYDGVNWVRAVAMDDSMVKQGLPPVSGYTAMDAQVDARHVKQAPRFDYKNGSIFIYPMASAADVAAGAKLCAEFSRAVTPFTASDYTSVLTDSTVVPGFDAPFHPILAYGPAMEFASKYAMPQLQAIIIQLSDYEQRLKRSYGSKDKDIKMTLIPYDVPEDSYNR